MQPMRVIFAPVRHFFRIISRIDQKKITAKSEFYERSERLKKRIKYILIGALAAFAIIFCAAEISLRSQRSNNSNAVALGNGSASVPGEESEGIGNSFAAESSLESAKAALTVGLGEEGCGAAGELFLSVNGAKEQEELSGSYEDEEYFSGGAWNPGQAPSANSGGFGEKPSSENSAGSAESNNHEADSNQEEGTSSESGSGSPASGGSSASPENTQAPSDGGSDNIKTGRVRFIMNTNPSISEETAADYADIFEGLAEAYGFVDAETLMGIARIESCFDAGAVATDSSGSYIGLMQLHSSYESAYGYSSGMLYDPYSNVECACRLLKHYYDYYGGNLDYAVIAYNRGPFDVENHPEYAGLVNSFAAEIRALY